MKFELTVQYEDGEEITVFAGQREMAAWEREKFGCSSMVAVGEKPILFFRYLAYAVLKRTRQLPESPVRGTSLSFDGWSDLVEDVEPVEDDETPDPTQQDQPQEA